MGLDLEQEISKTEATLDKFVKLFDSLKGGSVLVV